MPNPLSGWPGVVLTKTFDPSRRRCNDWCRCHPLDTALGRRGRDMKLATIPCRRQVCFTAERIRIIWSAGLNPADGPKVSSIWLGPNSTSMRAQRQPEPLQGRAQLSISGSSSS